MLEISPPPGIMKLADVMNQLGCTRTTVYKLLRAEKLDARKLCGKTVITTESLNSFLANLPPANIRKAA
jgi:hypothetical protein